MKGTNRRGEGEKSLLCDPGSELRLGGREKRRAKIYKRDEKKNKLLGSSQVQRMPVLPTAYQKRTNPIPEHDYIHNDCYYATMIAQADVTSDIGEYVDPT